MATEYLHIKFIDVVKKMFTVLKPYKKDISNIYFYAIVYALIQLSLPLGIQSIIGFVIAAEYSTSMVVLITAVVLGVAINGVLQVNQLRYIEKIQQQIFVHHAYQLADRLPQLNLKALDQHYLPELSNRFFEIPNLQKSISKMLLDIPLATIQILFGLLLLCFYHPVFIFFGLILLLILTTILYFSGTKGLTTSLEESGFKYKVAAWLQETARSIKTIRFSKGTNLHLQKTDNASKGYIQSRTEHFRILQLQYFSLIGFKVFVTAAILIVGSILLVNQQINIGQFIAAEIIILTVLSAVEKIILQLDNIYDALTSIEKISTVLNKPVEISGSIILDKQVKGVQISINNLFFGYSDTKPVLENISMQVPTGAKACIHGSEGSGKSTLLKLLSGSYTGYRGNIYINDIPLHNYNLASFRARTGILLQEQEIFESSIYDNITLGDADIHADNIIQLAKTLEINDFLQTYPNGFDTILSPNGNQLSSSDKQKILLLRCFIHQPALLLLEDPWRHLKETTKIAIQSYILKKIPYSTCIITSDDRIFSAKCDKIYTMQEGTLIVHNF